jgi:hypothetical protein
MAEVAEKKMPKVARVKNMTDRNLLYKMDGMPYIFRPGEEKDLELPIAGHFVGGHRVGLIDPTDVRAVEDEEERVLAALPLSEEQRLLKPDPPLKVLEIIDPNLISFDEPAPVEAGSSYVEEQGEKPFAVLTPGSASEEDEILAEAFKAKSEAKKK